MAEPGSQESRVEELRLRWREDPSSRIFVQLAEEYRRRGRLSEAVAVLEEGLTRQPSYITALAALGRCRLELGEAAEAARLLERVTAGDATHMLANKLLVEAYLRLGRWDEARERLDLYRLLNDADEEIPELHRRLEAAGAGGAGAEAPGSGGGEVAAADGVEPFGALIDGEIHRRYLEALAGEGIFPPVSLPEPAVTPPEPVLEAVAAVEPEPVEAEPVEAEPEPVATATEELPLWEEEPAGAPAGAAADEPTATVTLGNLYLKQGHPQEAVRIFRRVLERDPDNAAARAALARLEPAVPGAAPAANGREVSESLVADLLAGASGEGVTERKIALLGGYLERIRRRHVS